MGKAVWSFLGLGFRSDQGSDPPSSPWTFHALLIAQLIAAGLIFRIWLGPFLLERISRRVQVRRVSLRSIRGLFIRTSTASIRIDRVGLSYHPSPQASRRFGLKVEGLHIEVREIKTKTHPKPLHRRRRFTRIPSLAELGPTTVAGNILSSIYGVLDSVFRPVVRMFFVTFVRCVIKCLPALTQVVDFELDRAVVSFRSEPEAHITLKGMALSTTVTFSKVESVVPPVNDIADTSHRMFGRVASLRNRVSDSAKRVLGRAWGDTQGSASLSLKLEKVAGLLNTVKLPSIKDRDVARSYDMLTTPNESLTSCFELPGAAEIDISFRFGPTKRMIEDRSVVVNLRLPPVSCETSSLETFVSVVKALRVKPDTHSVQVRLFHVTRF